MAQYLNKFKGVIGKVQAEQVLRLLNKKRNTGQIRSVQEFSKQLEDLIRELTSSGLIPSLRLYLANENEKIDPSSYNFMLDRVQDDLEAAFQEARQIDQVQQSHEAIVRDVILKNLRAGIAELEAKISMYEFLGANTDGFDKALFSTFKESKDNRTLRNTQQATVIFEDPRTSELINSSEDALVELIGERLVLPTSTVGYHQIRGIRQIFDLVSPQSEILVEPPGTKIENIIDNQKGTYWVQSLLFSERKEYIKVQLEVSLGSSKEINFIEIDPAIRHEIVLESIHYLDVNNTFVDTGFTETKIDSSSSIKISKVTTNKLLFTFRNDNSTQVNFEYKEGVMPLLDQALSEPPEGLDPSLQAISNDLDEILSSVKIKDLIGLNQKAASSFSGYSFTTGFDNLRVGLASYETRGIYVSKPFENINLGEVGLKVIESRPYLDIDGLDKYTNVTYDLETRQDLAGDAFFSSPDEILMLGSIEYWLIKQDLSVSGNLNKTSIFPILPLGTNRVYHERLVFSEKSSTSKAFNDTGRTIFFTDVTNGNLKVYRNGTEITQTIDWTLDSDVGLKSPNSSERMVARITVNTVSPGDIYTISYDPLESTTHSIPLDLSEYTSPTGLRVIDLVGDMSARLVSGKRVLFDTDNKENEDGTTRIFLSIILRRNTSNSSLSPAVEEYALVAGSKDSTKFEE